MSEQISQELLKIMNEVVDNETTIAKIEASIFVRENERKINEKVAYLYNMILVEAKNFGQRQDNYFEDINLIITHYKQKLNLVYDESYCQYVNIQNELQEANSNRRLVMIQYQKLINEIEARDGIEVFQDVKESLKEKNKNYQIVRQMCEDQFLKAQQKFEKMVEENFLISSKSLQLVSEQNVWQRFCSKFSNIFHGSQKYQAVLKNYHKSVDNIEAGQMVKQMRNDIVEFVADIIEIKGVDENELEENARIGGRND